nr:transposase [Streptomyces sp. Ncost-T10-10d]
MEVPDGHGLAGRAAGAPGHRSFNRLKQWRRIATRYDKTAESHQAAVTLASLLLWA